MAELTRPRPMATTTAPGPGGGPGLLDDAPPTPMIASVAHGHYSEPLPVAGMTVRDIRRRYSDRFDIDPASRAFIDSNPVDERTVVQPGQLLVFAHRIGHKGRGPLWRTW